MRIPTLRRGGFALALFVLASSVCTIPVAAAPAAGHYRHFKAAIYIPVNVTRSLAEPQLFEHSFRVFKGA
jgi:hypothetical protein